MQVDDELSLPVGDLNLDALRQFIQEKEKGEADVGLLTATLQKVIVSTLSNVSEIVKNISRARYEGILDIIWKTVNCFGSLFVKNCRASKEEQDTAFGLSCWVILHMLKIFSEPDAEVLHESCHEIVSALLCLLPSADPHFLHVLAGVFLSALQALLDFECSADAGETCLFSDLVECIPRRSIGDDGIKFTIKVGNGNSRLHLQVNLCELIIKNRRSFCFAFVSSASRSFFWRILTKQLQFSCFTIKELSLTIIRDFWVLLAPDDAEVAHTVRQLLLSALGALAIDAGQSISDLQAAVPLEHSVGRTLLHMLVDATNFVHLLGVLEELGGRGASWRTDELAQSACTTVVKSQAALWAENGGGSVLRQVLVLDGWNCITVLQNIAGRNISVWIPLIVQTLDYESQMLMPPKKKAFSRQSQRKAFLTSVNASRVLNQNAKFLAKVLEAVQQKIDSLAEIEVDKNEVVDSLHYISAVIGGIVEARLERKAETAFLPTQVLISLCNNIMHLLHTHYALVKPIFAESIGIFQSVLRAAVSMSLLPTVLLEILCIISIPWLVDQKSCHDLKVPQLDKIQELSNRLDCHMDAECRCAISLVGYFPKDLAPRWRCHMLQSAMTECSERVRISAVVPLCLLIAQPGPLSRQAFEAIPLISSDRCQQVHLQMALHFGPVACRFLANSLCNSDDRPPLWLSDSSRCCTCDANELESFCFDGDSLLPFMYLGRSRDLSTLIAFAEGLRCWFPHVILEGRHKPVVFCIMRLLLVPSARLRAVLRAVIPLMISSLSSEDDGLLPFVIGNINLLFNWAQVNRKIRLHACLLQIVGQAGITGNEKVLSGCVLILMANIFLRHFVSSAAVALDELTKISRYLDVSMNGLFFRFQKSICKLLVDRLMDDIDKKKNIDLAVRLKCVSDAFQFEDTTTFMRRTQQYFLPLLVTHANHSAAELIRLFSLSIGDANQKAPLARNISQIYCHLVCLSNNFLRGCQFLEEISEWTMTALLKFGRNVDIELLLHLSSHETQVLMGLKILAAKLGLSEKGPCMSNSELANVLQPKLLGILVHFDNKLNNRSVPLNEKKMVYLSLINLISLMGKEHITSVRMRVLTTIKIGLCLANNYELSGRAWKVFIRNVELLSLKSLLPLIVANIQTLFIHRREDAVEIMNFLIIENRQALKESFHELYFIPDIEELQQVKAVVDDAKKKASNSERPTLSALLQDLIRSINHESTEVRAIALTRLFHLLLARQSEWNSLALCSHRLDPLVSKLFDAVLDGALNSDQQLRQLQAKCIGVMGAIDPTRMTRQLVRKNSPTSQFGISIRDDKFIVNIFRELCRLFLKADERNIQDCVAFALQELLVLYGISDDNVPAGVWAKFSEEVQEILLPLINSSYVLTIKTDWSKQQSPIYHSRRGGQFQSWVIAWTGYLSSKVKDIQMRQLIEACRGVIKNDSQMALHLLPYIVIQVLLEGDGTDHDEIRLEIVAILDDGPRHNQAVQSSRRLLSAQTIFKLFDHLSSWVRMQSNAKPDQYSAGYRAVASFLASLPQDKMAACSYECKAHSRGLMHLEQFVGSNSENIQNNLDVMQKLYLALDESDGVFGSLAIKKRPPSLEDNILASTSVGQLSEASVFYAQVVKSRPEDKSLLIGQLRNLMALGDIPMVNILADKLASAQPNISAELREIRVEAAWKLSQWEQVKTLLRDDMGSSSSSWEMGLANILLAAKNQDEDVFMQHLSGLRADLIGLISATSMERNSYHDAYDYITKLHILWDLEVGCSSLFEMPVSATPSQPPINRNAEDCQISLEDLVSSFRKRLEFSQSSLFTREPILAVQKAMFDMIADNSPAIRSAVGQILLEKAQLCRGSNMLQSALNCLVDAETYDIPELALERARWLWQSGQQEAAQCSLQRALDEKFPNQKDLETTGMPEEKKLCAQMCLLLGQYQEDLSVQDSNSIIRRYVAVTRLSPEWEEGHFYLGRYYEKIMLQFIDQPRLERKGGFVVKLAQHYCDSLRYGTKNIYHSMPRLFTLWLDYGSEVLEFQNKNVATGRSAPGNDTLLQLKSMKAHLATLNRMMGDFSSNSIPAYMFLTAFPQLISRICHAHQDVFAQLKKIIADILCAYPQQCVWMMIAVSKSSYAIRQSRCREIFDEAKSKDPSLNKFLSDSIKLADRLLELCNRHVPDGVSHFSISQASKSLKRLILSSDFSEILIPLQHQMSAVLPMDGRSSAEHTPFSARPVTVAGIDDRVEVLPSMQRPKKIVLRGSDGLAHPMLCKPKDDLRKDSRLMEFNGIVNNLLQRNADCRKRNLKIRTFEVTPLNETCGLLEWVNHTTGLRHILHRLYREKNLYTPNLELRKMQAQREDSEKVKHEIFVTKFLPKFPPILKEWFYKNFPDPSSWYSARLSYCRTTAVMSMVGYILGLGDRHGENLLLDSTNGELLHVDFNCLFNRGDAFEWPEVVPFRLTHNMVDAMGPLGCEGFFKQACEFTLKVVREHSQPLMSVLRTFIYDPLVEWNQGSNKTQTSTGEIKNEKAKSHISNINMRISGIQTTKPLSLPLSVKGQVDTLIMDATDEKRLALMYIGWGPYL